MFRFLLLLAAFLCPCAALALALDLPDGARQTASETETMGSVDLPVSGWRDGALETLRAEGAVRRDAWQIPTPDLTTLQILEPLRTQLLSAGFEVLFDCEARACGGFDFRYAIPVLPEPAMHVDLGDYRYAALRRGAGAEADYVELLVSRSTSRGFVQITQITASQPTETSPSLPSGTEGSIDAAIAEAAAPAGTLRGELEDRGRAVLGDLSFETGSSALSEGPFESLADLAGYLASDPGTRIVLVGHTDAEGSLAANVALSRKRAQAVRDRLVDVHNVDPGRVEADGVGYLAPLSSNATEAGRTRNRRVEVVLTEGG